METEDLSFPVAVERLAGEAGVPLPTFTREERAEEVKRRSLHDVVEMAAAFFEGALLGRALGADTPAKYLNSPDTPLFNKGRLLYNLHLARQPAHDRGTVIAVGYVDVISLSAAGLPNVVASLGSGAWARTPGTRPS